jgi:3-oxoacyl-[acyl-carrier-protein] synthase-3
MKSRGCRIRGWGVALPPTIVSNIDLESALETSDEWIFERSGIRTRRVAAGPFGRNVGGHVLLGGLGTTATLAVEAGRRALECGAVRPEEIGLLIVCTSTPDQAMPPTSSAVAGALGIRGGALDLNAACAGFAYGLVMAAGLLTAGVGKILLIGADTMTRVTDWEDRTSAFLFGDGAGAVVLEETPGPGSLIGSDLGADGSLVALLYADHGSGLAMNGREVFRHAVRAAVASARAALARANVSADEISLFVPHQANRRIMGAVADRLGIAQDRIASVIDRTGNTSSASIPLALVDSINQGKLADGNLVLFVGFGAGMTWASAVWLWST